MRALDLKHNKGNWKLRLLKTKCLSTNSICTCSYHTCLCFTSRILNWLYFPDLLVILSLEISKMLEFRKTLIRRIKPSLKKTPCRLFSFLGKLVNFAENYGAWCFLLLSLFFFNWNTTAICKHKIHSSLESKILYQKSKVLYQKSLKFHILVFWCGI